MSQINTIQNKKVIPDTHIFIYKNKEYPFKFDYFKYASEYFSRNKTELEQTKEIQLIDAETDDGIEITSSTINDFIQYVQGEEIQISKENAIQLHYLSNKYEITTLRESINEYIKKEEKEIVVELLYEQQHQKNVDTTIYEEMISSNLNKYLHDERLYDIKIPILYRIIQKYCQEHRNETNTQLNKFLIEILSKKGRSASILFSDVYFGDKNEEILNILLNQYSNIFEFEYITSKLIDLIYKRCKEKKELTKLYEGKIKDKTNEIDNINKDKKYLEEEKIKLEKEIYHQQEEHFKELTKEKENNQKMSKEYERTLQIKLSEISKLKEENEQIHKEKIKLNKENETIKKQTISKEQEYINEIEKHKHIIKQQESKIQEMQLNQNTQANQSKQPIALLYTNKEFDGIIQYLTDKTGGNIHDNGTIKITSNSINSHPKYLLNFDNNSCYQAHQDNDVYICYDFKDKKVKITNYSIKSFNNSLLKSWDIEVSNDGQTWIKIDEKKNCSTLKGNSLMGTFAVRPNDFSRYVRLHQTDTTWNGRGIWLVLYYIEFYGYLENE